MNKVVNIKLNLYKYIYIYICGAIFQGNAEAGLGAIIRKDYGLVMAALTQVIPLPISVEIVEVLAARRALIFALELGFDQVIQRAILKSRFEP